MAASAVTVSGRLCSSVALTLECGKVIDQRSTTGETLGFIKERSLLEGRAVLFCNGSRSSGAAAAIATKQKRRSAILDLDDDEEEDDDEQDDEATGFVDMEEWMRRKPLGFGLQEYDTSVEDRLLAEIEAEKATKAAISSMKKKKVKNPGKASDKQDAPPQGVEVYVGNLPRKRNVDRDLRAAFRSAQGLLHIRPIVDASDKTREPMCKGLAFLTFASDNEAKDFIRRYNGWDVRFGKAEKKVVCELAAVNSPFKKQASQRQGTDSPRLQVRDKTPTSPPVSASPWSHAAAEPVDARDCSASESKNQNSDNLEGREDEGIDSLDVPEDELLELEQEIWAELEDEDDFELDRELEGDDSDGSSVSLTVDDVTIPEPLDDAARDRQDLYASDPIYEAENGVGVGVEDKDEEEEEEEAEAQLQEAERRRGRGFGLTPNSSSDAAPAGGDKDKRIQELESKLKRLEVQLKKRETNGNGKVGERTPQSEEKIEALERRLLARARSAPEKDSKTGTAAKGGAGSKKVSSKVRSLSKRDSSRPKIVASKRLRKKEKEIYKGVVSKYSPLATEMTL